MPLTFILGPVRSGKSRYAEELAQRAQWPVTYVATARVDSRDPEWVERLALHAARRPPGWTVIETAAPGGCDLGEILRNADSSRVLLVDSLGTWLADRMSARLEGMPEEARIDARALEEEALVLADAMIASPAHVIAVSEEVGWGIVPEYPAGRLFRDVLGRMSKRLSHAAERAYLVVSGFVLPLNELALERVESLF